MALSSRGSCVLRTGARKSFFEEFKRPIPSNANKKSQNAHRPSDRPGIALFVQARFGVRTPACWHHERHFRGTVDLRFAHRAIGARLPKRQELEDSAWFESGGGLFVGGPGSRCDEFGRGLGLISNINV